MKGYNGLYLVGNYPDRDTFIAAAHVGLQHFDFLEVGIPFSDPVADGPVIEKAAQRVLAAGTKASDIFSSIAKIKKPAGKKIYIMTYANQVFARGVETFAAMMKRARVGGIILPDVPSVESKPFQQTFARHGIDFVHFITPESTEKQVREAALRASGFLYVISIRGITGGALALDGATKKKIALARNISKAPVVLGFGIRDTHDARLACSAAGGFIIGTRAIEILGKNGVAGLAEFFSELEAALKI
jgi:tryptophan synthase alpha chain